MSTRGSGLKQLSATHHTAVPVNAAAADAEMRRDQRSPPMAATSTPPADATVKATSIMARQREELRKGKAVFTCCHAPESLASRCQAPAPARIAERHTKSALRERCGVRHAVNTVTTNPMPMHASNTPGHSRYVLKSLGAAYETNSPPSAPPADIIR